MGEESNSLVSIETIHCTFAMHLSWLDTLLVDPMGPNFVVVNN